MRKGHQYYYYTRLEKGKEHPIFCRKKESLDSQEQILIDANELARGQDYFSIAGLRVSTDQTMIAYAIDTVGRRFYNIYFKDLRTGKILDEFISSVSPSFEWANDNKTLFYVKQNPKTLRASELYRHVVGSSQPDEKIYFEPDETFYISIDKDKLNAYLYLSASSTLSDEVRLLDANNPDGEWQIFQPREKNLEYAIEYAGDRFYVRTNYRAKNFRLMEALPQKTKKSQWREVIPERKTVYLDAFDSYKDFVVLQERSQGLTHLRVLDRKSGKIQKVPVGESTYVLSLKPQLEFDPDFVRYESESMNRPMTTYEFDPATRKNKVVKQKEVLGGFKTDNYVVERMWVRAKDGVRVPMSLVYRKNLKKDGENPALIYGYGAYGLSLDPDFDSNIFSLVDRGFVYALAHVRGGSDLGRQWYDDGKILKKKNTFLDFIACTEALIAKGFTSPQKLYAQGGSAGGLLMGAVLTMRPDLYNGVVAQVPFLDVLTTMLDASIPLTTFEYDEWGNPNQPKYYKYIKSYSPYDNLKAQAYPNLLVTTGYHDSQVQYWEPAKFVAKLRELKTNSTVTLFQTEMQAGHGGKAGRFERLKEKALVYAFLLKLEGKL